MFESCNTASDTYEEIAKVVKSTSLKTIQDSIAKRFYNADDIVEFLYLTIISKGNCILHGPGGFGKSQITKAFFEFFNINLITKVGHSGMDVESLLGIPNIKKLTEESMYEVAFENSVFSLPGVLLLEEFLDVKPTVAAALKDIITEGGYRRGDQFIDSKIGPIIICSNKSPEEVSTDLSTAAFYKERFPYSKFIAWSNYSAGEYYNLFDTVHNITDSDEDGYKLVAELCAASCSSDTIISPRIAFKATDLFSMSGRIESLQMISSLDLSKIDEIKARIIEKKQFKNLDSKFKDLIKIVNKFELPDTTTLVAFYYFANTLKKQLEAVNLQGDDLLDSASNLITTINLKLDDVMVKMMPVGKEAMYSLGKQIKLIHEDIQKYLPE